ncbi:hypothetical protein GCM10007887_09330 [Methylobacterium haplocladii]|uniref:Uncharacterized protein n=1 Tax=Methylobacterium haplocladii TaxID=1176176 RepID=A0A512IUJ9_9HYPH|nr:hypothetical protein MHA02_37710 [Methylobacterium haplocladii]GLS58275.1 hypothetical protein GCM10007887_09330 [Methylobacterium haplocladii]
MHPVSGRNAITGRVGYLKSIIVEQNAVPCGSDPWRRNRVERSADLIFVHPARNHAQGMRNDLSTVKRQNRRPMRIRPAS